MAEVTHKMIFKPKHERKVVGKTRNSAEFGSNSVARESIVELTWKRVSRHFLTGQGAGDLLLDARGGVQKCGGGPRDIILSLTTGREGATC